MPLVNRKPENLHKMFREMVFNLDSQLNIQLAIVIYLVQFSLSAPPRLLTILAPLPDVYLKYFKTINSNNYELMPKTKLKLQPKTVRIG